MTTDITRYPHMRLSHTAMPAGVCVLDADATGATITTGDGSRHRIDWPTLIDAANQEDPEGAAAYGALYLRAQALLHALPAARQGIEVGVHTLTGGATWRVYVRDPSGGLGVGGLIRADEGGDLPHRYLAEREADDIRARLSRAH